MCFERLRKRTFLHICLQVALHFHLVSSVFNKDKYTLGADDNHDFRLKRWADAAYHYIHNLNCAVVFFTTARECRQLVAIPKSAMNVYVAAPTPYGKYRANLPDESLTRSSSHEAVLVVDPYPAANFGHLVVAFYVDGGISRNLCEKSGGTYLHDKGECIRLALRRRCKNALERRSRRRNFARRCEINFLPVVHRANNQDGGHYMATRHNHLRCYSGLAGFGRCPELRLLNETTGLICNHIRDNTRRCSTTHETVKSSCRPLEICDQAVILSGGWNRQSTGKRHKMNVELVFKMLRNNGFKRRNIKVFFANGSPSLQIPGDPPQRVHPAAMKHAFRYHIRKMCMSRHCVDSLVIYMNNPARNDGTSYLWDVNNDGLADGNERYTVGELKEDLADCAAKSVHLIVDQSYSGEIAYALRKSPEHRNVIVFTSGRGNEYSFDDEYTRHWTGSNHTRMCTADVHQQSRNAVKHSSPQLGEGRHNQVRTTIFGAPCNVRPPFTPRELRRDFYGCQNVPTAVWLMQVLRAGNDDSKNDYDYDDDYDEHGGFNRMG
ncbi:uncharacterized protein LOC124142630 [Haliotis rufescens]|uniref:uncharacterized protein LOC124142630 n=1 Tax=Haliotis rufescens TaxID=6454 RepID=UPI00201EFB51|nr:uncharacterized protein LOC124142630 [Haliotis rufescens]